MTDRYRSPASSRGSARKKRRFEYKNTAKVTKDSDLDSTSSISSSRSSSTTCTPRVLAPSSTASSTRHRHAHDGHCDDDLRRSHRRRKHDRQHHHQHQQHHHQHQRKALPAPDEKDEKPRYSTAVTVREEYPVQTVPRTQQRDLSPDEEEEVYDHRPRPLSRRHGSRYPERRRVHSQSQGVNNSDRGFCMAAVMVLVSLFICMGKGD